MTTATLLVSCPDQKGLVAKISDWVFSHGGKLIGIHLSKLHPLM
jgi:formyltetrahydrofolate deformylase